jgi:hypothetical protein
MGGARAVSAPRRPWLALSPPLAPSPGRLQVGMRIALSCVLLGRGDFLAAQGGGLVQILCGFVGNVKDRGMLALVPVMDAVVQVGGCWRWAGRLVGMGYQALFGRSGRAAVVPDLLTVQTFTLLHVLVADRPPPPPLPLALPLQCFPSEGPQLLAPALQCLLTDLLAGRESGLVVAAALRVYARLLLQNGAAFLQLFQQAAPHVAAPADAPPAADPAARLLLALVDLWLDKFDSIGQPGARKLSALALCVLLTAPLPALLERLELIVTHITSVWFEVRSLALSSTPARLPACLPAWPAPCSRPHGILPSTHPLSSCPGLLTALLARAASRVCVQVEGSDLAGSLPIAYELLTSSSLREEDSGAVVPSEEAEGECSRRKALVDADPVATLRLSAFAKQQLEVAAGVHGGGLTAALNAMDCTLAGQLKAMLDSVAK